MASLTCEVNKVETVSLHSTIAKRNNEVDTERNMKDFRALLALPASLLSVMLATQVGAQELAWGDVGLRLADRNDIYRRRDSEIEQQPARQAPAGVRKMSDDEGEKFFFHYWDLGDELAHSNASSTLFPASRPLAAHSNNSRTPIALFGRSIFARDFQCPADTSSCSAAGNADLCCPTGQDCATVAGSICCCPPGETCTDSCAACNTAAGYTSCPNGGCCVPGAVCAGTGCVFYGTATTVVTLSTTSASPIVSSTTTTVQAPFTTQQPPVVVTTVQPSVLVSGYTTTVTVRKARAEARRPSSPQLPSSSRRQQQSPATPASAPPANPARFATSA
ncbi:hypothetical protein LTR87_016013 [Friedmanniomyces endolithicus]|nr:hypothetical protein LTR87_016013 [Friedmanniomyces endolithicus]